MSLGQFRTEFPCGDAAKREPNELKTANVPTNILAHGFEVCGKFFDVSHRKDEVGRMKDERIDSSVH